MRICMCMCVCKKNTHTHYVKLISYERLFIIDIKTQIIDLKSTCKL